VNRMVKAKLSIWLIRRKTMEKRSCIHKGEMQCLQSSCLVIAFVQVKKMHAYNYDKTSKTDYEYVMKGYDQEH